MTDRERLVKIMSKGIVNGEDNYGMPTENCLHNIADEILKEFTPKKKREYIRKSPCKCGANEKNRVLVYSFADGGKERYFYKCLKCQAESKYVKTKKQALTEWNKMNEVKE